MLGSAGNGAAAEIAGFDESTAMCEFGFFSLQNTAALPKLASPPGISDTPLQKWVGSYCT